VPKPSDQTAVSLALNEIVADGTASPQEMAAVLGCSESHIRAVISICDTTQLSLQKFLRLSAWLVDEKDETRHLHGASEEGLPGALGTTKDVHDTPDAVDNDDRIGDEVFDARQDAALAIEALKDGRRQDAARHLRDGIGDFYEALEDVQTPPD